MLASSVTRIYVIPFAAAVLLSSISIGRAEGEVAFALTRWGDVGQSLERWNSRGEKEFTYRPDWNESIDAITPGPDGLLYSAGNSLGTISIVRLDPETGDQIQPASEVFATYLGGVVGGMRHGIDGNLHVGGGNFPEPDWQGILRTFDGETGGRIGEFQVGTNRYISSVELGLDGAVYVMHVPLSWRPGFESSSMRVSRFDLQASFASGLGVEAGGFYVDPVGPAEDFSYPDATFGPDGALYVSNFRSNSITRHSPATGELINEFSDVYASDLTFLDGRLFGLTETNGDGNRVVEFDPQTGEVLRTLVDASQISAGCDNGCRFDAMVVFPVIVPEPPNAVIFFVVLASLGLLGPSVCRPAWRRR